ncbi:prostaglandin reductase 1 [Lingula anatina]|uniref:Prostaglandin reductase 1 n=1 Tax=Lingula anatina TaxID=7574 RepID=A0A2R2MJW5_LINAN|nr:prostaglandin reductase 1 [Lingula anatina]|eukprot:XP_023930514.1 prostaglandin reductase 1 [Lingula anatina]
MPVKAKKWILAHQFDGVPKDSDLELVEEELPELQDGQILMEAEALSVDPYMRAFASRSLKEGECMMGTQVGKVVESKDPQYPVGTTIVANVGWRTHAILRADQERQGVGGMPTVMPATPAPGLPVSVNLGVLGMPGATAYFGLLELCQPKAGEVVVVSAAAGAVGSLVGQIAKIKGCTVIGYAGTDEKCKWIKEELGFDHAINYKTRDVAESLKEAAPNGVDCYFDNVGGDFLRAVMQQMNKYGRIALCGSISEYNDSIDSPRSGVPTFPMIPNELRMEGFLVSRWLSRWPEAFKEMATWIKEGKLKYRETTTKGFENMREAFYGMLRGDNTGKAVVNI